MGTINQHATVDTGAFNFTRKPSKKKGKLTFSEFCRIANPRLKFYKHVITLIAVLQKVADGNLRLDRTIEISVTNIAEKKRTLKRIGPNLITIRHLMAQNHQIRVHPDTMALNQR